MPLEPQTEERVQRCFSMQEKLTLGEIEVLRALKGRQRVFLMFVEEQELRNIERKLGIE